MKSFKDFLREGKELDYWYEDLKEIPLGINSKIIKNGKLHPLSKEEKIRFGENRYKWHIKKAKEHENIADLEPKGSDEWKARHKVKDYHLINAQKEKNGLADLYDME